MKVSHLIPVKMFLGLFALFAASNVAIAEPNLENANAKVENAATILSADTVKTRHNGQESLLRGNVKIAFGNKITISGNEVLVMYASNNPQEISECIIYGIGLLKNGDHTTRFRNGVFKVKNAQFSAERTDL
jgi:lipopolysaccharide export system protein LptA